MKVLVTGGRDFADADRLHDAIVKLKPTVVVHGWARGADTLAMEWAKKREIPCMCYPARWKTYGAAAGPLRNSEMIEKEKPDMVLAMPGGRGTAHMIQCAEAAGIPVVRG